MKSLEQRAEELYYTAPERVSNSILSSVKPFYNRFFKEEFPPSLELAFVKAIGNDSSTIGIFYRHTGKIEIVFNPSNWGEVAGSIVHELTHLNYERETNLLQESNKLLEKLKPKSILSWRNNSRNRDIISIYNNRFLHECVAYCAEHLFLWTFNDDGQAYPRTDTELRESAVKSISSHVLKTADHLANSQLQLAKDNLYTTAAAVGLSLSILYQNDPNLWDKLKNIRSIKDLNKLVQ